MPKALHSLTTTHNPDKDKTGRDSSNRPELDRDPRFCRLCRGDVIGYRLVTRIEAGQRPSSEAWQSFWWIQAQRGNRFKWVGCMNLRGRENKFYLIAVMLPNIGHYCQDFHQCPSSVASTITESSVSVQHSK